MSAYPDALRDEVERYLEALRFPSVAPQTDGLEEAMRYSLLAGGKRIRPVLTLATARAIGREPTSVLPLAAAIELIHTYSLIHDDLPAMDDDDLRRGKPTCHVAFGEDVAILAGDTSVELRHLHELKTGALIAASVGCVLALEGMSGPATIPFRRFATELGVVFQIVDDILDVTGDEAELGKPRGSDERHGKTTYVSVHGLDRARVLAAETHGRARAALAEATGDTGRLGQIADYILTRTT